MKCPQPYDQYDCDEKLSFKDFTGRIIPEDISGKVIYASCFSQETPDSDIFLKAVGTLFIKCNLMNVKLPADAAPPIDCNTERYKVQNDLNDWFVDENNAPIKPIDHKIFIKKGLEVPKPEDIPQAKVSERIDLHKKAEDKKLQAEVVEAK